MNESPLFVRTHDFLMWLLPQTQKFPRAYRFTLSEHIQRQGLAFQDWIISAGKNKAGERRADLAKADIVLEQLRFWLRIGRDLELLTLGQYEHSARMLMEIGRLLGAWIKQA